MEDYIMHRKSNSWKSACLCQFPLPQAHKGDLVDWYKFCIEYRKESRARGLTSSEQATLHPCHPPGSGQLLAVTLCPLIYLPAHMNSHRNCPVSEDRSVYQLDTTKQFSETALGPWRMSLPMPFFQVYSLDQF